MELIGMNLYRQQIPPIQNPLTPEQYTLLRESFDPLRMSDTCSGVDIYCVVRQYICDILL